MGVEEPAGRCPPDLSPPREKGHLQGTLRHA